MAQLTDPEDYELCTAQREGQIVVEASLQVPAQTCYELFCDAELIPKWLWVVDTAVVQERDDRGRALRVDFIGALERASIGYGLSYSYDDATRTVCWQLRGGSVDRLAGKACFRSTGQGCRIEYQLESAVRAGLPPWADEIYREKPAEAVVGDFCEFVLQRVRTT